MPSQTLLQHVYSRLFSGTRLRPLKPGARFAKRSAWKRALWTLPVLTGMCGLTGCQEMNLAMPSMPSMNMLSFETKAAADHKKDNSFDLDSTKEFTPPFIGDYVDVTGFNYIILEGVGLVTGLDGTGGDPPPSQYRTQLLDDMRRRDIPDPNRIISSPSTALVIVRGYLPPMVQPGEFFDVEIRAPEGSGTTSLNGGWLLECRLTERAIVPGKAAPLEGKERARAQGPVLVSTGENSSAALLQRGDVVGGGVALESREMQLYLKNDLRSVRNSTRIATRIGARFFSYDRYGHRQPLAKAKTDQKVTLQIHQSYKDNIHRYVQVINNIAFRESDVERQVRMERLQKEIMLPEKSESAALQLEAIGRDAIPILKAGLKAKSFESRFHSASALAYLGESDGLEVLYEAARDEPAFRVFAFIAMSAIDDGETHMYLRQLMDNTQMETRYGAFRCMTTIDDKEPFVRGELLGNRSKLHVLDVVGEPMIHLTQQQKSEIVLFGSNQEFRTPLALSAGPHILVNCPAGSDKVVVSRYRIGEPDQRKEVSHRISDVLRAASELGASYPDLAQLLIQAEKQHNLPGLIGIDQLPEAGRYYERPVAEAAAEGAVKTRKQRIGRQNMTPNSFAKRTEFDEETQAIKPLVSPELTKEVEVPAETSDMPPAQTPTEEAKNAADPPEKKSPSTLRRLEKAVLPQKHGEMLYPEVRED